MWILFFSKYECLFVIIFHRALYEDLVQHIILRMGW